MKKKLILIAIIIVVIIAGGITAYLMLNPNREEQTTETSTTESKTEDNGKTGNYAQYDPNAVSAREDRVVLFFHAAWDPTSQTMEKNILENTIPKNVTIFKVNYDLEAGLRDKYKVDQTPTFIEIDDQQNEKNRFNAAGNPTLQEVINVLNL